MASARGFILQPTYRVRGGAPVIQLFGKLESGAAFLVEENRYRPTFFILAEHRELLDDEHDAVCEPTPLCDLRGRRVARNTLPLPANVPALRDRLTSLGCATFEADVRFPYRFLTDHRIRAGVAIEGDPEITPSGLHFFRNPKLSPAEIERPRLSVLSLDLETTPDASLITCASIVATDAGERIEEAHLLGDKAPAGRPVLAYPNERGLLEALLERIRQIDPDILVGWNVIGFDLSVLARRCKENGVACEIGRVPGAIGFRQDASFTRDSRADIPGRMVLDGIPLVRDAIRLDDYRLETAAQHIVGRGKQIEHAGPGRAEEIDRLYREDPGALVDYNIEDSRLVLDILEKESLLDLSVERSQLSGMQLDRVGASIASFDLVYLPALRAAGYVAPSVDRERKQVPVRGGAVLDSVPGLFRNVAVFDFKSLYPSLIRTFHLDPLAHTLAANKPENTIEAPNGARFSREGAILPDILEAFAEQREAAKLRGDRHADQAIKIMMNSMFGVLGSASCRFFDPDVANAITGFGQQTLSWTRDIVETHGVRVIYGDTDSVFVELSDASASPEEALQEAEALRETVGEAIEARIREKYATESKLVLELEHIYERFFMPRLRGGRDGSKKRYAGIVDGELEIVGLESVRRDWPEITRRLQEGLLERLFRDEDALPFAREVADTMRAGDLDSELVYVKRIRKGTVENYSGAIPPHVQAARKLAERGGDPGRVIRYVITKSGPEPVEHGVPLPDDIDRAHYIEKVLRPIADAILGEVDQTFGDALGEAKQLDLL
ncbi:MAG: DNA polymerase II [Myxococcota bacterium]|nr:DNA polymerase II [Myxococcota bacterium]